MSGDWSYGFAIKIFVWGYLVGGLTLLPATLALVWFWTTSPVHPEAHNSLISDVSHGPDTNRQGPESLDAKSDQDRDIRGGKGISSSGLGIAEEALEKLKGRRHVPDACAGYFAVCREYVPGGVNGKPPDRTTPAGAVISTETPSVYQSMYRSIFDRNKTLAPTIEANNLRNKKARNVFYVVLRLGHLMLYDNEDQLEVRHVISLAYYKVDIFAGGDRIPEGELWIKRNCIRLRQHVENDLGAEAKSFYLFSDNCSDKEDFYHAMLQAHEHHKDQSCASPAPSPLKFDTSDLVKLVQQLHASEENLHTRWINALIGRVFLALYKTSEIKEFIASKINKKIARVPKPALVSSVQLRKVDMGVLPPFITNPKLKELTVDGDLVVETDVSYKGNFRIEISATVRIDLGSRFKAREVTLILATVLKKLDGHLLIRIKPPPSNRLWITFEIPPRMEFSLEPIVSSRQITYGPVLRAIENRIREVVNETLVLPNWDDMPFTDTLAQSIRGGIWNLDTEQEEKEPRLDLNDPSLGITHADASTSDDRIEFGESAVSQPSIGSDEPVIGTSSSIDIPSTSIRPRTLRSSSSAAQVRLDSAHASAEIVQDRGDLTASNIRSLPLASPKKSPPQSQFDEGTNTSSSSSEDVSTASVPAINTASASGTSMEQPHARSRSRDLTPQEIAAAAAAAAEASNLSRKQTLNQTLNSASTAARNWLISKHNARTVSSGFASTGHNELVSNRASNHDTVLASGNSPEGVTTSDFRAPLPLQSPNPKSTVEPMGRGQPIPLLAPGTPMKTEKRQTWAISASASTFANLTKRKPVSSVHGSSGANSHEHVDMSNSAHQPPLQSPVPYTDLPDLRHVTEDTEQLFRKTSIPSDSPEIRRRKSSAASSTHSTAPPPLPKRRQRQPNLNSNLLQRGVSQAHMPDGIQESVLIIEAPVNAGSAVSSPVDGTTEAEGSLQNITDEADEFPRESP